MKELEEHIHSVTVKSYTLEESTESLLAKEVKDIVIEFGKFKDKYENSKLGFDTCFDQFIKERFKP